MYVYQYVDKQGSVGNLSYPFIKNLLIPFMNHYFSENLVRVTKTKSEIVK